jgi:hypothetical protein
LWAVIASKPASTADPANGTSHPEVKFCVISMIQIFGLRTSKTSSIISSDRLASTPVSLSVDRHHLSFVCTRRPRMVKQLVTVGLRT